MEKQKTEQKKESMIQCCLLLTDNLHWLKERRHCTEAVIRPPTMSRTVADAASVTDEDEQ